MEMNIKKMTWLDKSLEPKKRAALLVEHMNIDQKNQQLTRFAMKKPFSKVTKNAAQVSTKMKDSQLFDTQKS